MWGNGWEGKGKGGGLTPLLLVGDESEADEADEGAREDKVGGGGVVAGHTGGEEDDVGWYGDGEEEDLRGGREVRKLFCARGGGWGGGGGDGTDALGEGDEDDVEDEEGGWTDVLSQDGPPVVFGSLAISSFAPVIVT